MGAWLRPKGCGRLDLAHRPEIPSHSLAKLPVVGSCCLFAFLRFFSVQYWKFPISIAKLQIRSGGGRGSDLVKAPPG